MHELSKGIDYNRKLQGLEKVLSTVARPGEFFAKGMVTVPMPKLQIDNVGVISFPVHPAQAREIAEHATLAPYGRGEETIVDPNVRRVWQVGPEKFQIGGATWSETLKKIVTSSAETLGCEVEKVDAELYKLLLYEPGGFFLSHRDTEKTEGMFGTLVVVFPGAHEGGELVVRHAGRQAVIVLSTDVSEISYAAFYADCQHEVRPITKGHRLCLVYNLVFKSERGLKVPGAPENSSAIEKATEMIKAFLRTDGAPPKIVYLLDHDYTPEGLSFAGLKNHDRAIGAVLAGAAEKAGCAIHLGIVHIQEEGSAEMPYTSRWERGRRYGDHSQNRQEYEAIEVSDSSRYVSEWVNLQDEKTAFGEIPLGEGELLPAGALDNEAPDTDRVTEATGNEGATFERSYHRAALVLWELNRYAEVLLQSGVAATLPYFKQLVEKNVEPKERLREIAEAIIERWETSEHGFRWYAVPDSQKAKRGDMLDLLRRLEEAQLAREFIGEVVLNHYDGSENASLARCSSLLSSKQFAPLLEQILQQYMPTLPGACSELAGMLVLPTRGGPKVQSRLIGATCDILLRTVDKIKSPNTDCHWDRSQPKPADVSTMELLYRCCQEDGEDSLMTLAKRIELNPGGFAPDEVVAPCLKKIAARKAGSDSPSFSRLWKHAAKYLLQHSEGPPVKPKDWARPAKLTCNCEDCRELQRFAADPQQAVHHFRIRQDRRSHIEVAIRQSNMDMTCRTEEKGSPKTLVCSKNLASFERECTRHQRHIDRMKTILPLVFARDVEASALSGRMEAAVSRLGG